MKKMLRLLSLPTVVLAAILATNRVAVSQPLTWEPLGPGLGELLTSLHLRDNTLFAGTGEGFQYLDLTTGIWTSRDDVDWIGRHVQSLTNHPQHPGRIITGRQNAWFKGYLELTEDWGETETLVYNSDGGVFKDVQVDPFNPDRILACGWQDISPGELVLSQDGGFSWTMIADPLQFTMTELAFDPLQTGGVYLSGSSQVTSSLDGGETWLPPSPDLPAAYGHYCIAASPLVASLLLTSSDLGIYRSENDGVNWELRSGPVSQDSSA